ncbi:MAG TPA: bifunctional diaminohydroxyphosphoribosylaminopyrimidine deaminase/5-amino-6-(5-phosphoribosylamino)uracil reductase RibD [Candidatus Cloacimonas sp.]|nr:bifunctional diaminohydroxyphosphoribosylaminopyrimidine deaminase/5-amino-6-(5-phosphoribosylamino)uracil reductase RibD [Candidatus Cloacimonas sp.]
MTDAQIKHYMQLAIKVAEKGRGKCSPNPFVGSVIVKNNQVISEGWTLEYGSDHSEIQALKKAGKRAKGATLFVTLEPCSHYGKTPPCTKAIIAAGIKEVYIGIYDPNPLVKGKGIAMLKEAGIDVHYGFWEDKIRTQLEYYLCFIQKERPFVTWKTALTLDGKYAAEDGTARWITGKKAREYAHKLRSENDVVLTGIKTILIDDPALNVRLPGNYKQPLRVVLDPFLKIPVLSSFVSIAAKFPGMVITSTANLQTDKVNVLKQKGVKIETLKTQDGHFNLHEVLNLLYNMNYYSVLLETGSGIAEAFLKEELIDKIIFLYGAKILGGTKSPLPALGIESIYKALYMWKTSCRKMENDIVVTAYPFYPI